MPSHYEPLIMLSKSLVHNNMRSHVGGFLILDAYIDRLGCRLVAVIVVYIDRLISALCFPLNSKQIFLLLLRVILSHFKLQMYEYCCRKLENGAFDWAFSLFYFLFSLFLPLCFLNFSWFKFLAHVNSFLTTAWDSLISSISCFCLKI